MNQVSAGTAGEKNVPRTGVALALCPRCKGWAPADIGTPFTRPDGTWEWVQVRPHEHRTTGRSVCKPKGYARRVTDPPPTTERATTVEHWGGPDS